MKFTLRLLGAFAAALMVGMTAGCSNGPLDTSCEDFLKLTQSEQVAIGVAWVRDSGHGDEMSQALGDNAAADIAQYCQSHPDDKIGDLVYSITP